MGVITAIGGVIAGAGLGGGMTGGTVCIAGVGTEGRVVGADCATDEDGAVVGTAGCTGAVDATEFGTATVTAEVGADPAGAILPAPATSKGSWLSCPTILMPVSFRSTIIEKIAATISTAKTKVPS